MPSSLDGVTVSPAAQCDKDTQGECKETADCIKDQRGTAETVQCVTSEAGGTCQCIDNSKDGGDRNCAVGGVCMKETCADGARELETQIDELRARQQALKGDSEGDMDEENAAPTDPAAKKKALDEVVDTMAARMKQAPTFENLKDDLEGNAQTLAEVANSSLEFQPSLRSLLRELGPVRLETAVQDMTRGVHAVLQANKSLQPGSIAMMTSSDSKLLDGLDAGIDKALVPIVSLRKVLKSIKGNAALLRGKVEEWAETQPDEPQDNPWRDGLLPSEEAPKPSTAQDEAQNKAAGDLAQTEEEMVKETEAAQEQQAEAVAEQQGAEQQLAAGEKALKKATLPEIQAWAALLHQIVAIHRGPPLPHVRASRLRCRRATATNFL